MDKIEMSLDEIIKKTKSQGASRRGTQKRGGQQKKLPFKIRRGRIQKRNSKKISQSKVSSTSNRPRNATKSNSKLLITNLDYGVTDLDLEELFNEFGNFKKHSVHYNRSGRSLGTADIVFEHRADALKAIQTYNGVTLDGRTMNIQLTTSDFFAPSTSKGHKQKSEKVQQKTGKNRPNQGNKQKGAKDKQKRRSAPSVEVLDAELDAYIKNTE